MEERDKLIKDLDHIMLGYVEMGWKEHANVLQRAINYIEKGEM